jgi:CBS domain-containing protein
MSVKTILATKGSELVSIDFTADLAAAAKLLTKHRIGALVVLGVGGRLAGILSERDIVRTIAESGVAVLHLPVAQVMTRNVSTCDVNDSINSVIDRMTKGKFRHMPVLDNDRLAGMVSIGDVLKWYIETIRDHLHQLEASFAEFDMIRL